MSEQENYFREYANPGAWQREDPDECGCRGTGWFLSQLDTWHPCRVHPDESGGHPED